MHGPRARGIAMLGLVVLGLAVAAVLMLASALRVPIPAPSGRDVGPYEGNPRYLTDPKGAPIFLVGAYRFLPDTRSEWLPMLDYATANGLNAVRVLAISDGLIGDVPDNCARQPDPPSPGIYPFERNGGGQISADCGQRFNLIELDQRYWANFDAFLTEAESRGLVVVSEPFGVSGPFGGNNRSCNRTPPVYGCFKHNLWHKGNSINGPEDHGNDWRTKTQARQDFFNPKGSMRAIQERIMDQYLDITTRHTNIVYQPVNELFAYDGLDNENARSWANWVRDQIRRRKPGAVVLHNTTLYPSYGIHVAGYDGITVHAPYESNGPVSGPYGFDRLMSDLRSFNPWKAFVGYDYDVGGPYNQPDYQDYQRKVAWTVLTGGGGMYLVLENIFGPPWTDSPLPDPGRYLTYLARFLALRSVKPWDMTPWQRLMDGGAASATTTLLARQGEEIVAYLRSGGELRLDLREFPGQLSVEWYDPRNGSFTAPTFVTGGGEGRAFTPPEPRTDWVLLVRCSAPDEPPRPQ